ncbi:MAG: HAD family hydrolase [Lachnospiraceae bacterium]|nr:HAD family hydrolase [Lachnospiraceae bacterium]
MKIKSYKNFIFDLYGTLVDIRTNEENPYLWKRISELYTSLGAPYSPGELKKSYKQAVNEAAEHVQKKGEKIFGKEFLGEPDLTAVFRQLYQVKGASCDPKQAAMTANFFRILSRQKLQVYNGVKETLQRLRDNGRGVYLLSNAQRDFTRPDMELVGLTDCFDGILISSEEGCKKPSPVFFCRLLERYGLKPDTCLMMGNDVNADIAGARGVLMDTLYIHTETSPPFIEKPAADYTVMDGDWNKAAEILLTAAGQ